MNKEDVVVVVAEVSEVAVGGLPVAVFGCVGAVVAAVLVDVGVRLHVGVEH